MARKTVTTMDRLMQECDEITGERGALEQEHQKNLEAFVRASIDFETARAAYRTRSIKRAEYLRIKKIYKVAMVRYGVSLSGVYGAKEQA